MSRSIVRAVVALVGFTALASGVGMCARVAERGRYATPYSSLGAGPDGTRGLYLAAERLGATPTRWTRDLSGLPARGTLLAMGGCALPIRRPVRRYESEALAAWIRSGGVLVVAGATEYLPKDLGVSLKRPEGQCGSFLPAFLEAEADATDEEGARSVEDYPSGEDAAAEHDRADGDDEVDAADEEPLPRWATPASPILAGVPDLPMVEPARVIVAEGTRHDVLLTIGGAPAGVLVPHGRGAVVALAAATPFENERISESLGGVLLFRIRDARGGKGPLVFDEYHLGVGASRSIVQYLRSLGAGPLMAQLLFAIALLLFRLGARLGRPVAEPPPGPAGTEPYVEAIGSLYARSGDLSGVVEVTTRRALARIARHHRVEAADPAVIAARVHERAGEAAGAAVSELVQDGEPVTTRRAMVERLRRIDALELAATGENEAKGSTNGWTT